MLGRQMDLWLIKFLGAKNHQSPLIKKRLVHQAPALSCLPDAVLNGTYEVNCIFFSSSVGRAVFGRRLEGKAAETICEN